MDPEEMRWRWVDNSVQSVTYYVYIYPMTRVLWLGECDNKMFHKYLYINNKHVDISDDYNSTVWTNNWLSNRQQNI